MCPLFPECWLELHTKLHNVLQAIKNRLFKQPIRLMLECKYHFNKQVVTELGELVKLRGLVEGGV